MVHAGFGRHLLSFQRTGIEQLQFARRAYVQYMQARAEGLCACNGCAAAGITRLRTAYAPVFVHGYVLSVLRQGLVQFVLYGGIVLGMDGQQHVRAREEVVQHMLIADHHVAGAAAQEGLQAAHGTGIGAQDLVHVVPAHAHVERMVHHGARGTEGVLRFEQFLR